MDLINIKTTAGATVSIHFGSIVTTNLFKDSWYEILDSILIAKLKSLRKDTDESTLREIQSTYNVDDPTIARPYRRVRGASTSRTTFSSTTAINDSSESITVDDYAKESLKRDVSQRILNFFSEFIKNPSIRYINTLLKQPSIKACKEYTKNYFTISNHPMVNDICEKIKSAEFNEICKDLISIGTTKTINNKLKIYYGAPGTGKTTLSMKENPDAVIITCRSTTSEEDLMKSFRFEEGKPIFGNATFKQCLIEGKTLILDEGNMLPYSVWKWLQGVLDGKEYIDLDDTGERVKINDNFKVIVTMNLDCDGGIIPLPEAIVDRASEIKEFTVSVDNLVNYAF